VVICLTVSCFSKIQIGFTFLVPAYLGSPRKRAAKRMFVCVIVTYLNVTSFERVANRHLNRTDLNHESECILPGSITSLLVVRPYATITVATCWLLCCSDFLSTMCSGATPSCPPHLGIILYLLSTSSHQFTLMMDSYKQQQLKYTNLADLSADEIKQVCPSVQYR